MRARVQSRAGRVIALAGSLAVLGAFAALTLAERARPLRGREEPDTPRRLARNLALAGLSAAATRLAGRPVVEPLARAVGRRRWGLLPRLGLPGWVETAVSVLLMDYTLYLWHVMTHRVPLLWRFHQVHHADLDMDASTAIRFHFGEFVLGVPYRALQVALIGVTHQDSLQTRVNKTIGRKDQVSGSFGYQNTRADTTNLFGFLDTADSAGINTGANWNHIFTPNFIMSVRGDEATVASNARWAALWRSAASARCSSPSTPTSPSTRCSRC